MKWILLGLVLSGCAAGRLQRELDVANARVHMLETKQVECQENMNRAVRRYDRLREILGRQWADAQFQEK